MAWDLIVQFLLLTAVVSGGIIFALYRVFVTQVDGAKQRLERDSEAARARQSELSRKIKEADEELARRKKELREIESKMRNDVEAEVTAEKEKTLGAAREEAEDIITKAQNNCDNLRKEVLSQMEMKILNYSNTILERVLTDKVKASFDSIYIQDFIKQLADVDMSRIAANVDSAEIITARGIDQANQESIEKILKDKLGRAIKVTPKTDPKTVGGVILKFGSLLLDGSLSNAVKQEVMQIKQEVEKEYA